MNKETYLKTQYKILDCGEFKKLEIVDNVKFVRPAASAMGALKDPTLWKNIDVEFERTKGEGGKWKSLSNKSLRHYQAQLGGIEFYLKPTPFGHLGVFYEQISFWEKIRTICRKNQSKNLRILNLFAYTGGSTLASALGGASEVVHLDASKTSVEWAKENANLNSIPHDIIKWIVDDALSFVKREVRRGRFYDGIILDPPSYGRGPKNQVWKIEEDLPKLLNEIKSILSKDYLFLHLSAHTPGVTPLTLENLLLERFGKQRYTTEEMVITTETGFRLPSGSSCWMEN